jgi:hypothetical protein
MSHGLLASASFYVLLARIDADLAAITRDEGCTCGGRLDRADFPRKPRGGPADLDASYAKRIGLCCASCRKRRLPASVRFLGRRVYLGAVVVLVSAMRHGATGTRLAQLVAWLGVSRRTVDRWRVWWSETFTRTAFWCGARGRLRGDVVVDQLPASLVAQFAIDDDAERLVAVLRFLSPITTRDGAREARIPMGD